MCHKISFDMLHNAHMKRCIYTLMSMYCFQKLYLNGKICFLNCVTLQKQNFNYCNNKCRYILFSHMHSKLKPGLCCFVRFWPHIEIVTLSLNSLSLVSMMTEPACEREYLCRTKTRVREYSLRLHTHWGLLSVAAESKSNLHEQIHLQVTRALCVIQVVCLWI